MAPAEILRRPPFAENPAVGERGATTYRRLLDTSLAVFGERGFHDTRVEHITEAAGCSRPSFYQYFSDKDDVFWRLAGRLAEAMGELAESLGPVAGGVDGVEALAAWFDELITLYEAWAPVFVAFPAAMRDHRRTAATRSLRSIGDAVGDSLLRTRPGPGRGIGVDGVSPVVVTMLLRMIHYWRAGLGGLSRRRFTRGAAQTLHRLLYGRIDGVNASSGSRSRRHGEARTPASPGAADARQRRPQAQRTRQALLDAASAVLLDRGFHGTRVDDVVGAAGLSRGSFYRHFETKNHLFYALAERAASRTVERLDAWPADDDAEALRRWLGEWFDAYRADGGVISAWQEIDYGDPALAQYAMAMAGMVLDRLRAIVSRRRFGDASVDGVALLSIIEGVPYSVFVRGALDERVAIDAASFVIRRGLLGVDGQAAARSLTRTSRAKLPPMILALPASSNPAKRST